jgi:hypothetical protein
MMNTVLLPEDDLFAAEDESAGESLWDEYFSLGAWPQFGYVPAVLTTPDFVEGNTP